MWSGLPPKTLSESERWDKTSFENGLSEDKSLIKLLAIDTSLTIKSSANPELNFSEITNLSSLTSVVLFLPVAPFIIFKKFSGSIPKERAVAKASKLDINPAADT